MDKMSKISSDLPPTSQIMPVNKHWIILFASQLTIKG